MAAPGLIPREIPPGEILTYFGDIASGAIRPEDVRIEALTYRAVVNAAGQVVQESPTVKIISRYNFAIRAVYAAILDPTNAGWAAGLVRFRGRGPIPQRLLRADCVASPSRAGHWRTFVAVTCETDRRSWIEAGRRPNLLTSVGRTESSQPWEGLRVSARAGAKRETRKVCIRPRSPPLFRREAGSTGRAA